MGPSPPVPGATLLTRAALCQDALALGLLRDEALTAIVTPTRSPMATPIRASSPRYSPARGRADDRAHVRYQTDPPVIRGQISVQAQTWRNVASRHANRVAAIDDIRQADLNAGEVNEVASEKR